MKKILSCLSAFILIFYSVTSLAVIVDKANISAADPVEARAQKEQEISDNPFLITLYRPNFLLPFYYSDSPYQSIYENHTPNDQKINHMDVNFQVSLKVPLWQHMFNRPSSLYLAYTQISYWQAYNSSAFFRESNYEPALFIANQVDLPVGLNWRAKIINMGAEHQSNGRGGTLERSWNRIYLEGVFAHKTWMVSIKPWYVLKDSSLSKYNPDITHFLGHGRLLVAYKRGQQTFSLESRNNLESHFSRGAEKFTWSFPLVGHLSGYVLLFSGYGQSLIEYNHYTNSAGIGIALNDWI